jgi:hypothetical protein
VHHVPTSIVCARIASSLTGAFACALIGAFANALMAVLVGPVCTGNTVRACEHLYNGCTLHCPHGLRTRMCCDNYKSLQV